MKTTIDKPVITLNQVTASGKNAVNKQILPMFDIPEPTDNDVLSGRGVTTNKHAGNVNFRSLVALNKELYVTSTKKQKMAISRSIVDAVRCMNPPGRFLDKDANTGLWSDIGDRKAVEKTSQALRDGAAVLRKQLSEDLGDPEFLSVVFENDNSTKTNHAGEDGSAAAGKSSNGSNSDDTSNGVSKEEMKKQQMEQTQKQSALCKPRLVKSRNAKKGYREANKSGSETASTTAVPKVSKKAPRKSKMDQVVPHVPSTDTVSSTTSKKKSSRQSHRTKSSAQRKPVRSCSNDETASITSAASASSSKSLQRPASTIPVASTSSRASKTTTTSGKPQTSYSSAMNEDLVDDDFCNPYNPWLAGHSRNSSASTSAAAAYPPFFPTSPIGRHPHHYPQNLPYHHNSHQYPPNIYHHPQSRHSSHLPQQQHIFSCFQEPKSSSSGSGSSHSRTPMSPLHRSWSPRDFDVSPTHDMRQDRHSTGGALPSFSDSDIDIPSLDISFNDRPYDRAFANDDRSFSSAMDEDVDDDMQLTTSLRSDDMNVAGPPRNLKMHARARMRCNSRSTTSSRSCTPLDNFNFSPDCDFSGHKDDDLDDVMMKDSEYEVPTDDDRGLSPLSFTRTESTDPALFEPLPDLLHLPIASYGRFDKPHSSG